MGPRNTAHAYRKHAAPVTWPSFAFGPSRLDPAGNAGVGPSSPRRQRLRQLSLSRSPRQTSTQRFRSSALGERRDTVPGLEKGIAVGDQDSSAAADRNENAVARHFLGDLLSHRCRGAAYAWRRCCSSARRARATLWAQTMSSRRIVPPGASVATYPSQGGAPSRGRSTGRGPTPWAHQDTPPADGTVGSQTRPRASPADYSA
jgi:hypothetical protein